MGKLVDDENIDSLSTAVAAADSEELCSAFTQAEGGPPTPLEEPLSREMREALTRGDEDAPAALQGKRQIAGILRQGRFSALQGGAHGADGHSPHRCRRRTREA